MQRQTSWATMHSAMTGAARLGALWTLTVLANGCGAIHRSSMQTDKFIEHYLKCKAKQPSRTAGCFVLPWRPQATWWPLLEGMQCVRTWEPGVQLFTMPALKPGGDRRRLRPCHMKIAVWFDPPAREHPPSDRECDQPAQPTAQGVDNLEQTGL